MRRPRGINGLFAMSMGALAAVAVAAAAWLVADAVGRYRDATVADTANRISSSVMILEQRLLGERMPVTDALSAQIAADANQRALIARTREATDAAISATNAIAGPLPHRFAALRDAVASVADSQRRARAQVDAAIIRPRAERDPHVLEVLTGITNTQIAQLEPSLDLVGSMLLDQSGTLLSLFDLARSGWSIRQDSSIRVQQLIAPMNNHQPMSQPAIERVLAQDAALDKDWAQVRTALNRLHFDQPLQQAAAQVRQTFDASSADIHDMLAIGRRGGDFPMTFAQFGPKEVPALVAPFALRDAALEATGRVIARLYRQAEERLALALAMLVVAVTVGVSVTRVLRRRIVTPLTRMTEAVDRMAGGALDAPVPVARRADEIGRMAGALETLRVNAVAARAQEEVQRQERTAREARAVRLEALVHTFETQVVDLLAQVSAAGSDLTAMSRIMSDTAVRAREQASYVVTAAGQADSGVQSVAATAEQLSGAIAEISRQVAQSTAMTAAAVQDASQANGIVDQLAEGAQRIETVVSLISGIARQTNLLALNATIEAARAGAAGAGFSVVASEVKNLSQQTARATEDIARQIARIQDTTGEAVVAIRRIVTNIDQVGGVAAAIAAAVAQQSTATAEIARSSRATAASTQLAARIIGEVSQAASETEAASGQVMLSASGITEQSADLTARVQHFVAGVRAA